MYLRAFVVDGISIRRKSKPIKIQAHNLMARHKPPWGGGKPDFFFFKPTRSFGKLIISKTTARARVCMWARKENRNVISSRDGRMILCVSARERARLLELSGVIGHGFVCAWCARGTTEGSAQEVTRHVAAQFAAEILNLSLSLPTILSRGDCRVRSFCRVFCREISRLLAALPRVLPALPNLRYVVAALSRVFV